MAFSAPSVDDFKGQFYRDFPFAVPSYGASAAATLTAGAVSAIAVVAGGYKYQTAPTVSLSAPPTGGTQATATATISKGAVTGFTITDPGAGYVAAPDVSFESNDGDETDQKRVTDRDVNAAINLAAININPGLFGSQAKYTIAFNFLAAHWLCTNLQNSAQGVQGAGEWLEASKNVGPISKALAIPPRILNSPYLAALSKTTYGFQYLGIISPLLVGNFVGLVGRTSSE